MQKPRIDERLYECDRCGCTVTATPAEIRGDWKWRSVTPPGGSYEDPIWLCPDHPAKK